MNTPPNLSVGPTTGHNGQSPGASADAHVILPQKPRRKFTREFRREALRLIRESGLTIAETARKLQISEKTLGNWVYAARRKSEQLSPGNPPAPKLSHDNDLRMQISQLEAENARLKIEKTVLKSAILLLAKDSH